MINSGILFIDFETEDYQTAKGIRISATGGLQMANEEKNIRQAIFMLLMTIPGERVMLPEYGCDLYQLVFSPNDDTTAGLAIHFIKKAIERWEPRVEIVRIDASRSDGNRERVLGSSDAQELANISEYLFITIEYNIIPSKQAQRFTFPFNLNKEFSYVADSSESR